MGGREGCGGGGIWRDGLIREKMEEYKSTIHHSGILGIPDCAVKI